HTHLTLGSPLRSRGHTPRQSDTAGKLLDRIICVHFATLYCVRHILRVTVIYSVRHTQMPPERDSSRRDEAMADRDITGTAPGGTDRSQTSRHARAPSADEAQHAASAFTGVSKAFGAKTVLDGLDRQVDRGEVFALLGANGAGKTTCI